MCHHNQTTHLCHFDVLQYFRQLRSLFLLVFTPFTLQVDDADMTENFLQKYALGTQTFPTTNLRNSMPIHKFTLDGLIDNNYCFYVITRAYKSSLHQSKNTSEQVVRSCRVIPPEDLEDSVLCLDEKHYTGIAIEYKLSWTTILCSI